MNLAEYQPNQLLFLDESAANKRTKDRKYGWSPVGVAPHVYQSIKRIERWSLLPVYTIDGFNWEIIQSSFTASNGIRSVKEPSRNRSRPGQVIFDSISVPAMSEPARIES